MSQRTWILTDVDQDVYVDSIFITPEDAGGAAGGFSIIKRRLAGGLRDGVDLIQVDNGLLRFSILPTRGMGLWRAAAGHLAMEWQSPINGPVHPKFVDQWEPSGIGWLNGFDELLCRCGLESNGAPEFQANGALRHPLHGRIANCPAHLVTVTVDSHAGLISVTGVVDESRLFGNKIRLISNITTAIGRPMLSITDTVMNLSAERGDLELLYHINFGAPLARPGSRAVLPIRKLAPRDAVAAENIAEWNFYGPETPGLGEAAFFAEFLAHSDGRTRALLRSPDGHHGVSVHFNTSQLPRFTLWKNRQAAADGYVTGFEPGVNYPNVKSFEKQKGRVIVLEPGESRTFEVGLEAHLDASSVAGAERAIASIVRDARPEILSQPDPLWSKLS